MKREEVIASMGSMVGSGQLRKATLMGLLSGKPLWLRGKGPGLKILICAVFFIVERGWAAGGRIAVFKSLIPHDRRLTAVKDKGNIHQMPEPSRRSFASWLLSGGIAASLASFLYPVLRFLRPPSLPEAPVNEVVAASAQQMPLNSGKLVRFGSKPVLLIRVNETDWRAYGAVCTHLNCTVQYQSASQQIWCACHNGFYDLNGRVVSGPPPRPLEEFTVRLRGQEVVISRRA